MNFLTLTDISRDGLLAILDRAGELKLARHKGIRRLDVLSGKIIAMLFEKPSTRTRLSFETAIVELNGTPVFMGPGEVGLGKREAICDVARTVSRYVDGVIIRTFSHSGLTEFAENASVPVINALTDSFHPCQALADVFTIQEKFGRLDSVKVCFIGDGNNVLNSLLLSSSIFGFYLEVITPDSQSPDKSILDMAAGLSIKYNDRVLFNLRNDLDVSGSYDVVYTDVWVSMGQEGQAERKLKAFEGFQLNTDVVKILGNPLVMHCLPAHRGQEITDDVIDGPGSIVFEQAENRMHIQKALLEYVWTKV